MSIADTPRDRKQTRRYLIKAAQRRLNGTSLRANTIDELVDDIMKGGSFIGAVDSLVIDSDYWDS